MKYNLQVGCLAAVGDSGVHPELLDCVKKKLRRVLVVAQSLEASLPFRREQATLSHQHPVGKTIKQGAAQTVPSIPVHASRVR
jgi:hypothetical protein